MKVIRNLKISVKLILGFAVIAMFAIIIGVVGLMSIKQLQKVDNLLYVQNLGGMGLPVTPMVLITDYER